MLDAGFWILDARYASRDTKYEFNFAFFLLTFALCPCALPHFFPLTFPFFRVVYGVKVKAGNSIDYFVLCRRRGNSDIERE